MRASDIPVDEEGALGLCRLLLRAASSPNTVDAASTPSQAGNAVAPPPRRLTLDRPNAAARPRAVSCAVERRLRAGIANSRARAASVLLMSADGLPRAANYSPLGAEGRA